jgi:hypothetical protein
MALTHNSKISDSEPKWGTYEPANRTKLPDNAFADPTNRSYPHHWVSGGKVGKSGKFTSGTMYLHEGGLNAAWAAANGARSGQDASPAIKAHLQRHRRALGRDTKAQNAVQYEHSHKTEENEPKWNKNNEDSLPKEAFAHVGNEKDRTTWKLAHHYVKKGELILHKSQLKKAMKETAKLIKLGEVPPSTLLHLKSHRRNLPLAQEIPKETSHNTEMGKCTLGVKLRGFAADDVSGMLTAKVEIAREGTTLDDRAIFFDRQSLKEIKEMLDEYLYMNHDIWSLYQTGRKVQDRAAMFTDTRIESQKIAGESVAFLVGDIEVLDEFEAGQGLSKILSNKTPLGTSLTLMWGWDAGESKEIDGVKYEIPRDITYANLDFVTKPALGTEVVYSGSMEFQSFDVINLKKEDSKSMTLQEFMTKNPDLYKSLREEVERGNIDQLKKIEEEKKNLETQLNSVGDQNKKLQESMDRMQKVIMQNQLAEFQRKASVLAYDCIKKHNFKPETDEGKELFSKMPSLNEFIKDDIFDENAYALACENEMAFFEKIAKFAVENAKKSIPDNPPMVATEKLADGTPAGDAGTKTEEKAWNILSFDEKKKSILERGKSKGIDKLMPSLTMAIEKVAIGGGK